MHFMIVSYFLTKHDRASPQIKNRLNGISFSTHIHIKTGPGGRILEKIVLLVLLLSGAFMLWIPCFLETPFLSLFNFFHLLGRRCTLEVAKPTSLLC